MLRSSVTISWQTDTWGEGGGHSPTSQNQPLRIAGAFVLVGVLGGSVSESHNLRYGYIGKTLQSTPSFHLPLSIGTPSIP